MKNIIILLLILLTTSNILAQTTDEEQYMNAYIIVADTTQSYYDLRQTMFDLSTQLNSKIDTMDRSFNQSKNLICLSEKDKDELYAGEYFPRRYPSETLSLEYLSYYTNKQNSSPNTIALVAYITNDEEKAKQKLIQVKKYAFNAFIVSSKIYIGCMH